MRVAVAVIVDQHQRILITRREAKTTYAGLWEFPGGKLEHRETPADALVREINEEVGLTVLQYQFLDEVKYHLADKNITLYVFYVSQFIGEAACLESQTDLRWVTYAQLSDYTFPAANQQIFQMIGAKFRSQLASSAP